MNICILHLVIGVDTEENISSTDEQDIPTTESDSMSNGVCVFFIESIMIVISCFYIL